MDYKESALGNTGGLCLVCGRPLRMEDRLVRHKMIQPAVLKWTTPKDVVKRLDSTCNLVYLHRQCACKFNAAALSPKKAESMGLKGDALNGYSRLYMSLSGHIQRYTNLINKISRKQNNLCFLCSKPLKAKERIVRRRNPNFGRVPSNAYVICTSCNISLSITESKMDYNRRIKKREATDHGLVGGNI